MQICIKIYSVCSYFQFISIRSYTKMPTLSTVCITENSNQKHCFTTHTAKISFQIHLISQIRLFGLGNNSMRRWISPELNTTKYNFQGTQKNYVETEARVTLHGGNFCMFKTGLWVECHDPQILKILTNIDSGIVQNKTWYLISRYPVLQIYVNAWMVWSDVSL